MKFGLIPEFIGRLPVITSVRPLDRDALVQILTEPRNALVKQYARLFELDNVELEFDRVGAGGDRGSGGAARNRCPRPARDHGRSSALGDVRGAVHAMTWHGSSSPGRPCSTTSTRPSCRASRPSASPARSPLSPSAAPSPITRRLDFAPRSVASRAGHLAGQGRHFVPPSVAARAGLRHLAGQSPGSRMAPDLRWRRRPARPARLARCWSRPRQRWVRCERR